DVFERHRERAGCAIDHGLAKELQSITRCKVVALHSACGLVKGDLRAERAFQRHRRPGPGMQRPGNELPEWLEILKRGPVRIVIMRGGVVQVGGEPERIAYAGTFNEGEQVGDLEAAAARPVGLLDSCGIDGVADRRVGGNHLPDRARGGQLAFEPEDLIRSEQIIIGPVDAVVVWAVGAAITAHVEHEQVEQRAISNFSVDAPWLGQTFAYWQEFVEGAAGACGKDQGVALAGRLSRERLLTPPGPHRPMIVPPAY